MKKIIFSLLFILSASAFGQSFSVFNIDTTNFPTMKASFLAFDSAGKRLDNFSTNDFEVKENGHARTVTSVNCPQGNFPESLSSVLVMDVSGSMSHGGLDIAKAASNTWINCLNLGPSECALLSFSDQSYINRDFSTNKNNLINGINSLQTIDGTNYDVAFLDSYSGALAIAKIGKHKRIIIFLSDGLPNAEPNTLEIIKQAKANNITIYCLTIGLPAPECMKEFAKQTGGICLDNIENKEQAIICYQRILSTASGVAPCQLNWQTDISCKSGTNDFSIKLLPFNLSQHEKYSIQATQIVTLEFSPAILKFYNSIPGIKRDTIVKLVARNSDIKVTSIISSHPAFSFDKTSFLIPKNQSVDLKISYLPKDSNYIYSKISFATDICPFEMSAVAFFKDRKNRVSNLKLTNPNGGEELLVGSDNMISWEGIPATDNVSLEFSINAGKNWKIINDKTSGLTYNWVNIPPPTSEKCLIRVTQLQSDFNLQIKWKKCIGGKYTDEVQSIDQTLDCGYILAGTTTSIDGDMSGLHGTDDDIWVMKLNSFGDIIWQKCLGGHNSDLANSIEQTIEGGYILVGSTNSYDGDVVGNNDGGGIWIVKLNSFGDIEWQKYLGGGVSDGAASIEQTLDGGFVIAGSTNTDFGKDFGYHGTTDALVVKLNSSGDIEWQKCFGGSSLDNANFIKQTLDSGFIIAGRTMSTDGDIVGNHGVYDAWVLKLSSLGVIEWQKCLGGSYFDIANAILQTKDGGFIVVGNTMSKDGDIVGNHSINNDALVVKLNSSGGIEWQKCLGGSSSDQFASIQQANDGGFILAGSTMSTDGDVVGKHGSDDAWVVKISSLGVIEWQKCLGGSDIDYATSIIQTIDGEYLIAGDTYSIDGDFTGKHGVYNKDAWVVKLSADGGIIQQDESDAVFSIVEPKAQAIAVDMGKCLVSMSKDSVVTQFTQNIGSYKCRIDSIYIQGTDASAFKLIGGFPKYEIDKAGSHFAEFNFKPSRIGIHNAEIVVVTQSETLKVPITGEGVALQLQIMCGVLDFGKVEVGSQKVFTDTVIVKNISIAPISITKIVKMSPDLEQFDIISGGDPVTLNPGETHKMTLRFKPKFGGRTSGRIGFEYNGTGSPITATLFGTGIGGVVVSSSDSAYSGQKKNISLVLKKVNPAGLQAMAKSFSANLKFQGSILAPQDFSLVQQFKNDSITMRVSGDLPNDSTILTVPMIAGLGNVEETTIEISDFKLYDNSGAVIDYDMEVEYGTFKLLGICREGGTRLINPNSQAQLLSVRPNPATNAINIEYQLTEKGGAEFLLINDLGETVKQISYGEISDYTQRLETIKLDDLANGRYTLILQTPTISERRSVLVVR